MVSIRRAALISLVLAILAACGGSAAQDAQPSSGGPPAVGTGTLVQIRGDNLWLVPADGSTAGTQVTRFTNGNFANNPVFSPDGTLIAFSYHIQPSGQNWGGAELHLIGVDGAGEKTLVAAKEKGERAEYPSWSPDGKSLYFAHDIPIFDKGNYTGDTLTVEKADVAGGTPTVVQKDAIFPSTSRSDQLVWIKYNPVDSKFELNVSPLAGGEPRTLLTEKDFQALYNPRLSADGKSILFAGSGRTESKVARAAGALAEALNPLIPSTVEAHGLPWDPWSIRTDGTGLRKLVSLGSDEQSLAWSPDNQLFVLSNLQATYVIRQDGSGLNRILKQGDPGGIDWKA